jgi:hypothetical protein
MIFAFSDWQITQIFPTNRDEYLRCFGGRTSVSYFLLFHVLKIGVFFHRFGRLTPCFSGVEQGLETIPL